MPQRAVKMRTVAESLQEYGRGVAGGLVFSLPLLYTMEMWWAGFIAHPLRLLAALAATFVLLLGYNRYAGLRRDADMTEVAIDSVEELGIGLVVSALVLFLLGRVSFDTSAGEAVGKIVIEALVVAIGVSVGTAQLGTGKEDEGLEGDEGKGRGEGKGKKGNDGGRGANGDGDDDDREEIHFGGQLVLGFCGAVLFAANVAPTEEIIILAAESSVWRLLGLALFSLVFGALILHFSEFTGSQSFVRRESPGAVLSESVLTYAVALAASALILFFFGRFDGVAPGVCLAQTVVLGVAATLGASAGRLLLQ